MRTPKPCPSCLKANEEFMRVEAIQPLPEGARAPLGLDGEPQCHDCAAAGTLMRTSGFTWAMARIAVANDRQEQIRLPGVRMGLAKKGLMKLNKPGDLDKHHKWLKKVGLWND